MMHTFIAAVVAALLLGSDTALAQNDIFVMHCNQLTLARSDPVVQPGGPSGHMHNIVGGTAFNRTMSNTRAVGSVKTTCDNSLDRSNYWIPQLYHIRSDGKFELVPQTGNNAYYINRQCDYDGTSNPCVRPYYAKAPPAGLRMVTGDPTLRTFSNTPAQRAISHHCLSSTGDVETNSLPLKACDRMRAQVTFPSCWDGKNLDSANHKDHMAFPTGDYNGGRCPQSHPVAILQIFNEYFYETKNYPDRNFVYAMGDKTGYGLHGDFINGWTDQQKLTDAPKTCTTGQGRNDANCSLHPFDIPASNQSPEIPTKYEEEVGLNGPIDKLPGNNPVTGQTPS